MSRRASLPGAEELFRRTSGPAPEAAPDDKSISQQIDIEAAASPRPTLKQPKHTEKVTFYCTPGDLTALEEARLKLRADHGVATDRGRIVRAALEYVLEDFAARGGDSILFRRLGGGDR